MRYLMLKEHNLPIGSGAIDSAIGRVVNLRLKGASIYWLEAKADSMHLLRAYDNDGRLEYIERISFFD